MHSAVTGYINPNPKSLPVLNTPNCCCCRLIPLARTPSSNPTIIISSPRTEEGMETRRDSETLASCYQTRPDLVCHVAGIGVMAKIFEGTTLRLCFERWYYEGLGELSVKDWPSKGVDSTFQKGELFSGIVCLVCKCAHYAYSLFFSSWQRPILWVTAPGPDPRIMAWHRGSGGWPVGSGGARPSVIA